MNSPSIYEAAQKAVAEHKWIQSEKVGYDLGIEAVREWTRSYWLHFYRVRFVQHLRGELYWKEFDERTFGVIGRFSFPMPRVLDEILNRVKYGAENLDLIAEAIESDWPMDQVIAILEALDINSQRLPPPPEESLLR